MNEAEEAARRILAGEEQNTVLTTKVARAYLRLRSSTVEECAKVADAVANDSFETGGSRGTASSIARAIRSLSPAGKPPSKGNE